MNVILHITQRQQWDEAKLNCACLGDTLDSEGFIHCCTPLQVIQVANRFFANQKELVLLCIDCDRVKAEIKYEGLETQELFPHIYGDLNVDAVLAESGGVFAKSRGVFAKSGGVFTVGVPPTDHQLFKTTDGVPPSEERTFQDNRWGLPI